MTMAVPTPIGIIGLGLMGAAMTQRLVSASIAVIGFDVDPVRAKAIAGLGGAPAGSIAALARQAAAVILAVYDTDQVEAVVENDILPALGDGSGKLVLCTATCDPDRIATLAERVGRRGLRFLEVPVSGSSAQVAAGEGVAMVGGDAETVAAADALVAVLFPARFHIGKVGDGGRAKLATNLILGLNRLVLAEGLLFAERLGLDSERFLDCAKRSAAYSQAMDTKGMKMVRGDFTPQARASQHLKDIALMLAKAEQVGQALPLARLHADILEACVAHGEGDLDNSVVIAELRRRGSDH
jgi:3-hydroxyisobutyrate dehydrogenase-like beta-hydroxyacid dehydrogenase